MSEQSHASANVAAGVITALVICALVVILFSALAKESIGSVALLTAPLTLYGIWAAVFYSRGDEH
jgi:hypothetical protein